MKHMRKLLAMVLAVIMVMSLATTAFAAEGYSITINNTNKNVSIDGMTYKAYKVFDLTLGAKTTTGEGEDTVTTYGAYSYSIKSTDWAWTTLVADATTNEKGVITTKYGIKLTPSASDATLYAVEEVTEGSMKARELADALTAVLPETADGSAIAANEKATIELNKAGYYAVYGTAVPKDPASETVETVVAALALTTTDPTATVVPKVEVPTLDKKITGQHVLDDAGKAATAEVGSTVSFQIDSSVPDLTGYSKYTFTITDTMTNGLTFTYPRDVVVTIDGENKTEDVDIVINGQKLTVTIPYTVLKAAKKGDAIVVTYSAVINEKALTTNYEKNTAKLTYSNNPSTDETNDTPEKTVYVIDVDINVNKVAGAENGSKLANAQFKVFKGSVIPADDAEVWYKWDDENKKVTWVAKDDADTFTTDNNGKFVPAVQGLEAEKNGTTYGLLEIAAPDGYNLLDAPVIVTLTAAYSNDANGEKATVSAEGAEVTNGTVTLSAEQNTSQPLATATVINKTGTELPSTGGMGTTLFYVFGAILMVGAAVLLVTKRRMNMAE